MGELEAERGRFKETLQRYGETLAATHDLDALVGAVLDTAVQATRARGGRLLLYDAERGEAVEQARHRHRARLALRLTGGRRGRRRSRGRGARLARAPGHAVTAGGARGADPARAPPARAGHRGRSRGGGVHDDDVEALSALAVQAGVAIENARLHRVVERQAVTDALTGLANRRQFYEVLGREYERAQRFGQPVSLILLDIDDFKQINDSRGHLAGDAVCTASRRRSPR